MTEVFGLPLKFRQFAKHDREVVISHFFRRSKAG
jgi:hypothetical protein